jgi:molecular chaperone DnaK
VSRLQRRGCSRLLDGRPDGDVTPYDPVYFSFDPNLHDKEDLARRPVGRREDGPDVEERYVVTPGGAVAMTLTTRPAAFTQTFRLARRAPVSPSSVGDIGPAATGTCRLAHG